MPRVARKYYISSFLHIMVQGINKEAIFKEEFYKNLYLKLIRDTVKEFDIKVLAYAIMDNHIHILLHYNNIEDVSKSMQKINQSFAQMYNKNEGRVGYVFRDRYRSEQIKDKSHLYTVLTYIHFNPYKAGIIKKLSDYKFSSYNQYIKGNIKKENAYILFGTYDYKKIFVEMHKQYFNKNLSQEETYKEVINNFKKKNGINTTEIIIKEKNLLIQLILELEEKTDLKDKEICKLLGLGKNRITNLKKDRLK